VGLLVANRTAGTPSGVAALPNISAAAWQPFYFGPVPPSPSPKSNLNFSQLADIYRNCKVVFRGQLRDTAGTCAALPPAAARGRAAEAPPSGSSESPRPSSSSATAARPSEPVYRMLAPAAAVVLAMYTLVATLRA
jgi:hypothetical protein